MIGEKKITEAVNAYIGYPKELGEGIETSMRRDAFRDGVEWFKEAIWHDASEEPEFNKRILVQHKTLMEEVGFHLDTHVSTYPWELNVRDLRITKWCYLADLLPKGGEE